MWSPVIGLGKVITALYQHCSNSGRPHFASFQLFRSLTACAPRPLQKRSLDDGDPRAALLQSAASTPASSSATFVARGPLPANVKEESDPPVADGDSGGAVVTSACHAPVRAGPVSADSDGGKFTRGSGLQGSAAAVLAPGFVPVPPLRAAALAASATVARMAAAEMADGAPHTPVWLGLSHVVAACLVTTAA